MKQTDLGLDLSTGRTRKQILLEEMNQVMPWADLLSLIAPRAPVAKTGRPPFDLAFMLRIHCLQQWFGLSDLGAEEALFETGKRKAQKHTPWGALQEQAEQLKASVRAKVEHPFRVIKRQFGYVKVHYRGLAKNTAQLITLFALSNIWMARSGLIQRAPG